MRREEVMAMTCPDPSCSGVTCRAQAGRRVSNQPLRNPPSAVSRSGFTLLEVLVALTIFSVILACLYSSFFLSRKAVDTVDDTLLALQESRTLLDSLRREIEASIVQKGKAYTVFKIDDRDFYGKQASRITFTTFSPLMPGLARIGYFVEEEDGRLVLRKKISSAYREDDEASVILLEQLDSFTVEVKFQDTWIKSWNSELTGRVPEEVRITIVPAFRGDGGTGGSQAPYPLFEVATLYTRKTI